MQKQPYRLLEEQLESLKAQYAGYMNKLNSLNIAKKAEFEGNAVTLSGDGNNDFIDNSLLNDLSVIASFLKETKQIISNYEIIKPTNSNKIELGTNFTAEMEYGSDKEIETYILVDTILGLDPDNYVSAESKFGKAILGKNVADDFSYLAPVGAIKGKVLSINKPKKLTKTL